MCHMFYVLAYWCLMFRVQVVVLVCLLELHIGFSFWLYCALSSVNIFELLQQCYSKILHEILFLFCMKNSVVALVRMLGLGFIQEFRMLVLNYKESINCWKLSTLFQISYCHIYAEYFQPFSVFRNDYIWNR